MPGCVQLHYKKDQIESCLLGWARIFIRELARLDIYLLPLRVYIAVARSAKGCNMLKFVR